MNATRPSHFWSVTCVCVTSVTSVTPRRSHTSPHAVTPPDFPPDYKYGLAYISPKEGKSFQSLLSWVNRFLINLNCVRQLTSNLAACMFYSTMHIAVCTCSTLWHFAFLSIRYFIFSELQTSALTAVYIPPSEYVAMLCRSSLTFIYNDQLTCNRIA